MTRFRWSPTARAVAMIVALSTATVISSRRLVVAGATQLEASLEAADSVVRDWVDSERIPGAVLLVSRHGEVLLERAYGWAQLNEYRDRRYGPRREQDRVAAMHRLQDPRPMTTDTVFDLASVTKVMATTFAVMLLVDAGELRLDEPVRSYLPDFGDREIAKKPPRGAQESVDDGDAGKRSITLRHLLVHRSGLHQWKPIYYHADDADTAYAYIRDLPLAWSVGAERHYSDLGFMLLGRVVEAVAGRSLGKYLDERLYAPLGLSATGFLPRAQADHWTSPIASLSKEAFAATSHGNPYEYRMVHDPDFGYRIDGDPDAWNGWRRGTLIGEVNDGNAYHAFDGVAGHAGLFSTAADLNMLLELLLERGRHGERRHISAGTIDTFLTPAGDAQALGWQVPDYAPPGSFVHSGFTGTYVLGVPTAGLGVVLLTNRQNVGVDESGRYPDVAELQRAVASALILVQ